MAAAFSMLFAKIAAVLSWIGGFWVAIFVAIWSVCTDAFSWLFDQVLQVAISAIGAIDVSSVSQYTSYLGAIPADLENGLELLGVGTALEMIAGAIVIRMVLQLIPFTRLGS